MLFPIIGGIIVFQEWATSSIGGITIQTIGIAIIAIGVFALSFFNEQKKKGEK
jgi:hypothetical protein